ncbi:MAG: OmpH family outer membrane protein [Cyanobacteria bacterium SIG31]|nr:OmpH family outer membrane protein [Cyanobacteria bacterium SIG31]
MKNWKLGIVLAAIVALTGVANAAGVGYIDYIKVIDNYEYAKKATKEVDAKGLEMQQYLVDKEKEYKALDTPLKKQTFEQKTAQEFKAKEQAYIALKQKREQEVYTKIREAAKAVMVEQKLDAIMDQRGVFVGGLDITDMVINKLKGAK